MRKIINPPEFVVNPGYTPEEYAALWGADPSYMQEPNLPGDGYLFYNFAVEGDDPEFLAKFIPAIERTIRHVETHAGYSVDDLLDLHTLLDYVKELAA
ncbi:MAG: hypothetical protein M0R80_28785 [Proteobacteria bacterium]|jgi:hypothetical protein|nr:hypothetical protein [Pseudomonadota bacterium]